MGEAATFLLWDNSINHCHTVTVQDQWNENMKKQTIRVRQRNVEESIDKYSIAYNNSFKYGIEVSHGNKNLS